MNAAARDLIAALRLEPLAREGGFFRPTWRSETASAILFLLTDADFSALHRLAQDEIWHFYAGDSVEHVTLRPGGPAQVVRLGPDVLSGETRKSSCCAASGRGRSLCPRRGRTAARGSAMRY